MRISENIPIASMTTMRIGGLARYTVSVETPAQVRAAVEFARQKNLPLWVMGGGANTLGRDAGYDGVIILSELKGIKIVAEDGAVYDNPAEFASIKREKLGDTIIIAAKAGELWDDIVKLACELGYSGIEAMSMIPGTVGAAPVQNIGAYGQELAQVVESVEAYDQQTDQFLTLKKPEMEMSYRYTRFNHGADAGRFIITEVSMWLHKNQLIPPFYNSLQAYVDKHGETDFSPMNIRRMVSTIRSDKLPDPKYVASAGSFFKNVFVDKAGRAEAEARGIPVWPCENGDGKINAGWLIEQCGLKGQELFGFKVSEKAALVLINENAKTYAELDKARAVIVNAVREKFGFLLEQEPVEITEAT